LASAHIKAIDYLNKGGKSDKFNLGNGKGYSVREVVSAAKEVTGVDFTVIEEGRREGDSAVLVADSTKAKTILNWVPQFTDLNEIVKTAWDWNLKLGK
jgi:UDP-glucose 4-epimerase